jgi:hypothetical protein
MYSYLMHIYFNVKLSLLYQTDDKHLKGKTHDNVVNLFGLTLLYIV